MVAAATVAIAAVTVVVIPSRQSTNQSTSKNDLEQRTEQRGLRPNVEPMHEDQKPSETTGANTKKGNTVQQFPDSKGFQKKTIRSEAGIKQGTADKAPTKGYETVDDEVSIQLLYSIIHRSILSVDRAKGNLLTCKLL